MFRLDLTIDVHELFVRYLLSLHPLPAQTLDNHAWWSLAALLANDSQLWEVGDVSLASSVVEGVYAQCSPLEACVLLGELAVSRYTDSKAYGQLCAAVCERTQDTRALRELARGVCEHHNRNPNLPLPPRLASLLLASS